MSGHLRLVNEDPPAPAAPDPKPEAFDTDWDLVEHAVTAAVLAQDWLEGLDHHLDAPTWLGQLTEAIGALAHAVNQQHLTGHDRYQQIARREAIKTASIALAIARRMDQQQNSA